MSGIEARDSVEAAVRRELFGPQGGEESRGTEIDCSSGVLNFDSFEEIRGQFHEASSKQEILTKSDPLRRYGIGVLHAGPVRTTPNLNASQKIDPDDDEKATVGVTGLPTSDSDVDAPILEVPRIHHDVADTDDFDLSDANSFNPSAMAISFRCKASSSDHFGIKIEGAYYDRIRVNISQSARQLDWWVRRPFTLIGSVSGSQIRTGANRLMTIPVTSLYADQLRLEPVVQIYSRPVPTSTEVGDYLITVAIRNESAGTGAASALFQMRFSVEPEDNLQIEPYPEALGPDGDEEEQNLDLLYRNKKTFAIGHGCAANWAFDDRGSVSELSADAMPSYEVVSLTPTIYKTNAKGDREAVTVSMAELGSGSVKGQEQVEALLGMYGEWISEREREIGTLPSSLHPAAGRNLERCKEALDRMTVGWLIVQTDPIARRAFQLANQAMLQQQIRSRLKRREAIRGRDGVLRVDGPHPKVKAEEHHGLWRPFQIAFLLATLPEVIQPQDTHRSTVDLIFFPTGGGKTEAYLGLSAISLLARRLRNPDDAGTDTLMRYTLRLLTAQQFLRAAALICVLEDIRSLNQEEFGSEAFGIGVWLGGDTTPNTNKGAVQQLKDLRRNPTANNPFLLLRCPWCGAQMGPKRKGRSRSVDVIGYEQKGASNVVLRCIDDECRFSGASGLPIHVIDEEIYSKRPSIIIGTVDKFAMLAWRPEARAIFGLDTNGDRDVSPPGLIIQDELHLISGPLGSMVGLYESVIHELCTDRRGHNTTVPKVIASTATARRYEEQIRSLFGRSQVRLFPPHGLEEGRSFFAEPAQRADGTPEPGRRYVGIMSPSLGSIQTVQVRVAAATLQVAQDIPESDRDGYWTNLNFFNSLRELGNTVSLLTSDVPDYLTGLRSRDGIQPRWPRHVMELTSRRRNDEIPQAIEQLETTFDEQGSVDICLATNIIEVGIDIDRLGLMTIIGQPKTTAQYIQVSGRVGRRPDVSPGLILTIYGAAKPRDRSHYERFRTYHQSLYAQVEPTSVTPFAAPVLRRALHAASISYIRQTSPAVSPYPFPEDEFHDALSLLHERAATVDEDEVPTLESLSAKLAKQWSRWERTEWSANVFGGDPEQGLMRFAGTLPALGARAPIWDVPTSMRNVDAECRLAISLAYNHEMDPEGEEVL